MADSSLTRVILVKYAVNSSAMAAVVEELIVACVLQGRITLIFFYFFSLFVFDCMCIQSLATTVHHQASVRWWER